MTDPATSAAEPADPGAAPVAIFATMFVVTEADAAAIRAVLHWWAATTTALPYRSARGM
jgi:hypothetical protein